MISRWPERWLDILVGFEFLLVVSLLGCACATPVASTKPVFKIGLVAPFEGLSRPVGYDALRGVKLALAETNASGGVAGHMVELVALDSGADPAQAEAQARELAADPAVVAAVAGWSRPVADAEIPEYGRLGLPVVVGWTAMPDRLPGNDAAAFIAADSNTVADLIAKMLPEEEHILVVGDDRSVQPFGDALPRAVFATPPVSWSQPVVESWAGKLLAGNGPVPEVIVLACPPARAGQALAALARAGWNGSVYVAPEAAGPLLADTAGAAADGAFVISPAPVGPDVTGASIVPQGVTELGAYGVMAYDATKHVLAAVQAAAGKPTREGIRSSLRQVRSVGLTGDIAFGPSGLRESPPSWLYQIEPGGFPGASAGQVAP